jgi:hypothetical protein
VFISTRNFYNRVIFDPEFTVYVVRETRPTESEHSTRLWHVFIIKIGSHPNYNTRIRRWSADTGLEFKAKRQPVIT